MSHVPLCAPPDWRVTTAADRPEILCSSLSREASVGLASVIVSAPYWIVRLEVPGAAIHCLLLSSRVLTYATLTGLVASYLLKVTTNGAAAEPLPVTRTSRLLPV